MTESDGRKVSHEALEGFRIRAVKTVLAGESPEVAIKSIGMSRSCIYKWLAAYYEGGFDAHRAKKLFGRPPTLLSSQMKWLFRTVKKDPRQLLFSFALWTAKMLGEALYRKFGFRVSKATMCRVLRRMGLPPHKPLHRAIQQNAKDVELWLTQGYPNIQESPRQAGATIYFGYEAGVSSSNHSGATWGEGGNNPSYTNDWKALQSVYGFRSNSPWRHPFYGGRWKDNTHRRILHLSSTADDQRQDTCLFDFGQPRYS